MTKRVSKLIKGLGLDKEERERLFVVVCEGTEEEADEVDRIPAKDYTIADFNRAVRGAKERSCVESKNQFPHRDHTVIEAFLEGPEGECIEADGFIDYRTVESQNGKIQ